MRSLLDAKKNSDNELVRKAKAGDAHALNELVSRHKDLLEIRTNQFRQAPIPTPAIYGESIRLVRVAVQQYRPEAGIQFRTFLEATLRGLNRYVNNNKRVDRVPEHRSLQIGRYKAIKSLIKADKSREPTSNELADELGWSLKDVLEMEKIMQQGSYAASGISNLSVSNTMASRQAETVDLMYTTWTSEEKLVFDYSLGAHGKPQLISVKRIAKNVNITTDKVYRIRRALAKRLSKEL
jgi:DNA-directed RNA polymerase specialized sigma subunit